MSIDFYHCDHKSAELRRRIFSNDSIHYQAQCLRCGTNVRSYKKTSKEVVEALALDRLADWDYELQNDFNKGCELDRQAWREENKVALQVEYDNYLNSPQWQRKRQLVLKRDEQTCQGCLQCKATHVHHLTYEHVENELLFELVSLCEKCHLQVAHSNNAEVSQ